MLEPGAPWWMGGSGMQKSLKRQLQKLAEVTGGTAHFPRNVKAIFAKRCATCHGAAGEGKEQLAKMLKVEIRQLGSKEVQAHSDADFRKMIREGKGKMKPVKEVTDQEMPNLIAFFRTLAHKH